MALNETVEENRERLIALQQDICWMKKIMSNHLAHHWCITVGVAGALLTAVGTLVMYIIARC